MRFPTSWTVDSSFTEPSTSAPNARPRLNRFEDIALGITMAVWGVGSVAGWSRHGHEIPLVARVAVGAIHLTAASLFLRRERATEAPAWRGLVAASPALLLSGIAFRLGAARLETAALTALACAATWTCASLLTLGTSFAVLPSRRTLIMRGPYAWVRHPAYAGELLISLLCLASAPSWQAAIIAPLLVLSAALRCNAEERVLARDAGHASYMQRVRFRLVPFVW